MDMTGGFAIMDSLNAEKINKIGEEKFKSFVRKHLAGTGSFTTAAANNSREEGLVGVHAYSQGLIMPLSKTNTFKKLRCHFSVRLFILTKLAQHA